MAVKTAKNELSISRVLNAPRELVWEAWSKPEHLAQWWGPNGFTLTLHQMVFAPGGEWNFIMHGPDGTDYVNHIVFLEIVRPEKITYRHVNEPKFDGKVVFSKHGDQTRVSIVMKFATDKDYDIAAGHGAKKGLGQTVDRLATVVSRLTKGQKL